MGTRDKVRLDRLVATPSAWALNLAARSLGRVLQRSHATDPASVKTIVVAKLLGMGSIIQATPLLLALKRAYPSARLCFLTLAANRPLVERLASVDQGLYLDDRNARRFTADTLAALRTFVRGGIDLYFDLEVYSAASSCLSLLSLARNRFGLYRHSAGFKRGLFTHLLYFNVNMPIRQIYLQLLAMAGTNKTKLLSANIWVTDMAHFAEMNSVWDAWVSPGNTPARATVEAKLASPDYKVEIMVVAAR